MQYDVVQSSSRPDQVVRTPAQIKAIIDELALIRRHAERLEQDFADDLAKVDPRFRESATNLLHYMALRHVDIRPLQVRLASLGLSSLGRCERHVMASLKAVLGVLQTLATGASAELETTNLEFAQSSERLDKHAAEILGSAPSGRSARIIVTLAPETAMNQELVAGLMKNGMNVARINCGHDDEKTWSAMIDNVRTVSAATGNECKIVMDLAGPRLRTGPLAPGPKVLRLQPRRDALGRVISPKRMRIALEPPEAGVKGTVIPVTDKAILKAKTGDFLKFRDTRGKRRKLRVVGRDERGLRVECYKPAYIETGTKLTLNRHVKGNPVKVRVGELPATEQPILLHEDDQLILHKGTTPGQPAVIDSNGEVSVHAHVACTLPEVFRFVQVDEAVFLNDGKIKGNVESVTEDRIVIRVTHAKASGSRLRGSKGINFPDSELHIDGLSDKDREDLKFIAANADAVAFSFVRKPQDILDLYHELEQYRSTNLGIILKIETEQGFNNLARLLLTAMHGYPVGVMIARGDLAVECGWERLAEIQEEILWLCEAAHVPVIWATQVLEGKTKNGNPSRAEISDAAMSQRADGVMLNKGPHIIEAVRMLDDILRRMQHHQDRKTATLGKLAIADALDDG
ncbi:MAG: pyruvate kinase [Gammaproteobacteria bacterium]|nr:pyruvate kinase [Gammaproteobacteria bacterium]